MRGLVLAVLVLLPLPGAAPAEAETSSVRLPGLIAEARVTRDRFGIPHIEAAHRHDLFFMQGWIHARDRLFHMDVSRRLASGTLSELLGKNALPGDVQARTIGLRRAAVRSLAVHSPRAQEALRAYAEGVNAYVASNPLPPEYGALRLSRFEPWTPTDSAVIGKLLAFRLSFDLDIERTLDLFHYLQKGAERGFDGMALFASDVYRSAPFDPAATVPDASVPMATPVPWRPMAEARNTAPLARAPAVDPAAARLASQYLEKARASPLLRVALERHGVEGSNEWVVSGRHTTTGRPLLASDPHLPLGMPSTFYPIHLRGDGLDVIGSGFAGVPSVVAGHNRWIAWGSTTNPLDVTDTYLELIIPNPLSPSGLSTLHMGRLENVRAIQETFRANVPGAGLDNIVTVPPGNGIPAATLIVPRRNNGPIVELDLSTLRALSIQYAGFSATRELDAFLAFDEARNLDEFRAALQLFDVGSQNFAYADVDGNIAYFSSAEIPLREDLNAGYVNGLPPFFIRDGLGGNEWLPVRQRHPGQALPYEILPPREMPHLINPPAGWFVNANNDPVGTTLDNHPLNQHRPGGGIYYLNPGYDGFRAGRITQLLRERLDRGGKLSPADMQELQADVTLLDAQFFTPWLVRALTHGRASSEPVLRELANNPVVAEAVGRLSRWDHTTPTGIPEGYDAVDHEGVRSPPSGAEVDASVAATLYSVWRGQLVRGVIDRTLAAHGLTRLPPNGQSLTALRHLLEHFDATGGVGASGIDFFARPGVARAADRRDIALLSAMAETLALLRGPAFAPAFQGSTNLADYRWGLLHRIVFNHPLGPPFSVPSDGGPFPPPLAGLPGIPTDGGFGTVDASSHPVRADSANAFMFSGGPAHRFVAELASGGVSAVSSLPGGTSGLPGHPRSINLLPSWLTNDAFPLLFQEAAVRAEESVTRFVPGD